ncbi:Mitochondrial import inner membrane translocase subunit [Cercospora zeina]
MSFLGFGGRPQPSSAEKIAAAEAEIEMVGNMFNQLVETCTKKCIPNNYREGDLNKGESVCLDRCVAKFFEVNIKVSEKMQGEAQSRQSGGGFMSVRGTRTIKHSARARGHHSRSVAFLGNIHAPQPSHNAPKRPHE